MKKTRPTIEWPGGVILTGNRARWARHWSRVPKADSKRSTPMKIGGALPGSAPGQGRRSRKGRRI